MSRSAWETLPDVQESLPNVWEPLPDVRYWSINPPGCLRLVGRVSRMSGSGQEAYPHVQEWSGCFPRSARVVG